MKRALGYIASFALLSGIAGAQAPNAPAHILMAPTEVKWGDPPPVFEKGMSFSVVSGDPSKPGIYVVRAKMPAGYKIAPHWHPGDESVTVVSGQLMVGMGETFDAAKMHALGAGSFAKMPKEMRHYAQAKGATVIQVHGIGPFGITYVNAADDPRPKTN